MSIVIFDDLLGLNCWNPELIFEPRYEKTGILHMRRRSALR